MWTDVGVRTGGVWGEVKDRGLGIFRHRSWRYQSLQDGAQPTLTLACIFIDLQVLPMQLTCSTPQATDASPNTHSYLSGAPPHDTECVRLAAPHG